jgi:hypothetical protein
VNVTFTPQAADAVRRYAAARGLGPDAGLRITVEEPDRYSLAVVTGPRPIDVMVMAGGVPVFAPRPKAVGTVVIDGGLRRGEPRLRAIAIDPGDDPVYSPRPGRLRLDHPMLARLQPDLFRPGTADPYPEMLGEIAEVARQLNLGDCNAAVVLASDPFRVAAYADELDCVSILNFPRALAAANYLAEGSRLVAVNFYRREDSPAATGPEAHFVGLTAFGPPAADLFPGRGSTGRWQNFGPLIADLLATDHAALADRRTGIPAGQWDRCAKLGTEYVRDRPGVHRDGRPRFCWDPRPAIA